jgi:hypothetical protein
LFCAAVRLTFVPGFSGDFYKIPQSIFKINTDFSTDFGINLSDLKLPLDIENSQNQS